MWISRPSVVAGRAAETSTSSHRSRETRERRHVLRPGPMLLRVPVTDGLVLDAGMTEDVGLETVIPRRR